MSDSGRLWLKLLLTTSGGSISHTDQNGKTVTRIGIGSYTDVCIHIYATSSDTIKIWGSNEQAPADASNAIQLGDDIVADAMVVIEDGPTWMFIEFDTDGGGDPYAIISARHRVG